MALPSPVDAPAKSLSFTSWNDDKLTTIVLLHGGFTCRLEFALVLPYFSDFHVLLPDLPLHSASRCIKPATTDNSAWHVAQLIQSHAHGGKAHVVGVSMGGYIGQCLALDQPDLVLSLFVTGAAPLVGKRLFMAQWTRVTYYTMRLMLCTRQRCRALGARVFVPAHLEIREVGWCIALFVCRRRRCALICKRVRAYTSRSMRYRQSWRMWNCRP